MGVVPQFSQKDLEAQFAKKLQARIDAYTQTLRFVGERFVVAVRTKINADESYRAAMRKIPKVNGQLKVPITEATPRYKDVDGPLTSSVGYLIQDQGKLLYSSFPGSGTGKAVGEAAAAEMARMHPSGMVLIVVAGMQYAAAVESLGYDVLTGSSFVADRELEEALKPLREK